MKQKAFAFDALCIMAVLLLTACNESSAPVEQLPAEADVEQPADKVLPRAVEPEASEEAPVDKAPVVRPTVPSVVPPAMKKASAVVERRATATPAEISANVLFDDQQKAWDLAAENSALSLSTELLRKGDYSVKWDVQPGASLVLTAREVSCIQTKQSQYFNLFVFNPTKGEHQLTIEFLDAAGEVTFSFPFLLNYAGWRQTLSHFQVMPIGKIGQAFESIRITSNQEHGTLFFAGLSVHDTMGYWGTATSFQTPFVPYRKHMVEEWNALSALKPVSPSSQERKDLKIIRKRLQGSIRPSHSANLGASLDEFSAYEIKRTEGAYYTGKPIESIGRFLRMLQGLTWGYEQTQDESVLEAIELSFSYLLNQGYELGSNLECGLAVYAFRDVPGFLPLLNGKVDPMLLDQVYASWAWYTEVGAILEKGALNTDWLGMSSKNTLIYAFFGCDDIGRQVAMVRAWKSYMNYAITISYGAEENLKPDGSIYHHEGHYPARYACIAWSSLIDQYHVLRGTKFSLDEPTYNRIRSVVTTICNNAAGNSLPWGLGGRSAEPERIGEWVRLPTSSFKQLAELGGAFCKGSYDPRVAAMANRIFPDLKLFNEKPETEPTGFYQVNYVPGGSYRQNNWLAYMRGMTDKLWGTECYIRDGLRHNVYGYFQGHGSLEIWYPGTAEENGFRMGGWDYNLFAGTTALRIKDPKELDIANDVLELDGNLRQRKPFCGSVAFGTSKDDTFNIRGQYGLFAMDFESKRSPSFSFRKSVFCLNDEYIVAIGNKLSSNDSTYPLITTLFQRLRLNGMHAPFLVDGKSVEGLMEHEASGSWLLDPKNTGYWVKKGALRLADHDQTYPVGWEDNGTKSKRTTAQATWAYIEHGTDAENNSYEYVIVPGTTAQAMEDWSRKFAGKKAYKTLCNDAFHAVQDSKSGLIGVAVFEPTTELPGAILSGVDTPCLLLLKPNRSRLSIALSNPNLADTGWNKASDFKIITLTLNGVWRKTATMENVRIAYEGGKTKVYVKTQHGKRYQVILKK